VDLIGICTGSSDVKRTVKNEYFMDIFIFDPTLPHDKCEGFQITVFAKELGNLHSFAVGSCIKLNTVAVNPYEGTLRGKTITFRTADQLPPSYNELTTYLNYWWELVSTSKTPIMPMNFTSGNTYRTIAEVVHREYCAVKVKVLAVSQGVDKKGCCLILATDYTSYDMLM
jgi:hypothetical protein